MPSPIPLHYVWEFIEERMKWKKYVIFTIIDDINISPPFLRAYFGYYLLKFQMSRVIDSLEFKLMTTIIPNSWLSTVQIY